MTAENFAPALAFVLEQEGGYVDDPRDPGGATNLGITLRVLTTWRHVSVSKSDVMHLSGGEAAAIYRADYWNVLHCDSMPSGVDLMIFDCGVNTGTTQSTRFLQQSVGVANDGAIGPYTLAAVMQADAGALIASLSAARLAFYAGLPSFDRFGKGWTRRVNAVTALATGMLAG